MKKSLALSINFLTLFGVGIILALCVIGHQTPIADMENHNTPAPVADSKVMAKAEAGRTCSTKPVLTNTIVVIDEATGKTRIMGFDATFAAAKAGTVKVITYCVKVKA